MRCPLKALLSATLVLVLISAGSAQQDPVTAAEIETLAGTIEATGAQWFEAVEAAHPAQPDLDAFAEALRQRDDIVDAQAQNNRVMVTSAAGIILSYDVSETGALGYGRGQAVSEPAVRCAGLPTDLSLGAAVPAASDYAGDLVPDGKALIMRSSMPGYDDLTGKMENILDRAGLDTDPCKADLKNFPKIADASVVIINTHGDIRKAGGSDHYSLTANRFESTDAGMGSLVQWLGFESHFSWLKEHELALAIAVKKHPDTDEPTGFVIGTVVFDTWFANHIDRMVTNSAVLLLTCKGANLSQPWEIFRERGASVFLGFTGRAGNKWASNWAIMLLERVYAQGDERPTPGAPLHRAQSFSDAFEIIKSTPPYGPHPPIEAVLKKRTDRPDGFSAHPHIDQAWIYRMPGSADYTLALWGSFGPLDGATLLLDGQPLELKWAMPGIATPWNAVLPPGASGDLQLIDQWGRRSNRVTISQFQAQMTMNYEDQYCAGTVQLQYTEPVVGARLYREIDGDFVFAGSPAWNIDRVRQWSIEHNESEPQDWSDYGDMPGGWPLVWGIGDVQLRWDFESVKVVDDTPYVTSDHGARSYRATDMTAYFGPSARLQVHVPMAVDPDDDICEALVRLEMHIDLQDVTVAGEPGHILIQADPDEAEATYDCRSGVLERFEVQSEKGRWRIDSVQLAPDPYDPDDRASVPGLMCPWFQ